MKIFFVTYGPVCKGFREIILIKRYMQFSYLCYLIHNKEKRGGGGGGLGPIKTYSLPCKIYHNTVYV